VKGAIESQSKTDSNEFMKRKLTVAAADIIWDDAVKAEFVKSLEEARTELAKLEGSVGKAFGECFNFFFVPPQVTYVNYHKDWPTWLIWLGWNTRNPFPGLTDMMGCKNQVFTTLGATVSPKNPHGLSWNPNDGYNTLVHTVTKTGNKYGYISYRGKDVEWYLGTRPTGSFGVALRKAHAKGF